MSYIEIIIKQFGKNFCLNSVNSVFWISYITVFTTLVQRTQIHSFSSHIFIVDCLDKNVTELKICTFIVILRIKIYT